MFKNILVAIDGSKASYDALDTALVMAGKFNSKLYLTSIVNTANMPTNVGVSYVPGLVSDLQLDAKDDLLKAENITKPTGINYEINLLEGEPRAELINFPAQANIDLIVMGKTQASRLVRFLSGSVTRYVTEHSHKSILIVE